MAGNDQTRPAMARQLSNAFEASVSKHTGRFSSLPGGRPALFAFALSLVAYTLQTEAAQYVQQGLGYRKPFLSLYLGHSGFSILLPLHLLFLRYTTKLPYSHYFHIIAQNIHWQLSTPTRKVKGEVQEDIRRRLIAYSGRDGRMDQASSSSTIQDRDEERQRLDTASRPPLARLLPFQDSPSLSHPQLASRLPAPPPYINPSQRKLGFDLPKLLLMLLTLMGAITIPALSWYCAVPMTSMADITALYNTFSVWALVFSVWFFGEKWSRFKVASVLLACGGVIIVAYGGGEEGEHRRRPKELDPVYGKPITSGFTSSGLQNSSTSSVAGETGAAKAVNIRLTALARGTPEALDFSPANSFSSTDEPRRTRTDPPVSPQGASNPLLGDLLALFGAITMAAYEMAFKLLGTLPDEEEQKMRWSHVPRGNRRSRTAEAGPRMAHTGHRDEGEASNQEEEQLLADEESEDQDENPQFSKIRGRKEDNRGLGRLDNQEETQLPSLEGIVLPLPIQSTERSAIWTPPTSGGDAASPSGNEMAITRAPMDYGSGSSSPFLSVESGESVPKTASSAEASHSRVRGSEDPLNVQAVKDRLIVSDYDRRRGMRKSRTGQAREAVQEEETEDEGTETESVLQSGDEEEILAGGTRLGRSRPVSRVETKSHRTSKHNVLFDQDLPFSSVEDTEENEEGDEPQVRGNRDTRQRHHSNDVNPDVTTTVRDQTWIPPPLPFGLHANIMTTGIGIVTAGTLWIGVLTAHLTGWEPFELPHNAVTVFAILFVVFSGVIFNACFMLLLALWGPVTASVSCLLSTVAVAIFDALLRGAFSVLSLLGCCFIVGGFGLLMMESGQEGH